jgi:hypothetical protein
MTLLLLLAIGWCCQSSIVKSEGSDSTPATRIQRLFHTIITTDDQKEEETARAEVNQIYAARGLPAINEVGDEASYEFVALMTSEELPIALRTEILSKVEEASARHAIPADAAAYYEARLRIEKAKKLAAAHPPTNPALRDEIEQLSKVDQAVRQQSGFDAEKMAETDKRDAAPLQAILDKYGVPTYAMVGEQAAADFVVMIQHQPTQFRQQVLPKLKANVDAGQADPGSYAKVYDRSQRDLGKNQLYGEQLECNAGEKMHEAPVEDEAGLNQRRAELGLIRAELYERIAAEMMPQFCPPTAPTK